MSADKPLLIFPRPRSGVIQRQGFPHGSGVHFPGRARQVVRLDPQFAELERALSAQLIELQTYPSATIPEQVLVLEIIGSIQDFSNAVRRIQDMEWLVEFDEELDPDEDFFNLEHSDRPLDGQIYLVMTNQTALRQLRSLWTQYKNNPGGPWSFGLTRWRDLFDQLRNIRPWDTQDRLRDTGVLEDWQERVELGQETVKFEAELWFRNGVIEQQRNTFAFRRRLEAEGGTLLAESIRPEIHYHGVVGQVPIRSIMPILAQEETLLISSSQVMFFRPVGQAVAPVPEEDALPGPPLKGRDLPEGDPVIALFDGLPLQNHELLAKRLIVDDPDGWEGGYPATDRNHGTGMASLIIHGELDASEVALSRPVYVRPILNVDPSDFRTPREEFIPETLLPADLMFRAVRRLFERDGATPPVAPTVRIINLSVGDSLRQFDRFLSPWARMLDWLSWKYQVLFIVSAGNYLDELVLDIPRADLAAVTPEELETAVINAMVAAAPYRRLLAPAEAVNVITVGALHSDESPPIGVSPFLFNPYRAMGMPSLISRVGHGFRRAVKPDILMPGGQQTYLEKLGSSHEKATLRLNRGAASPGQSVASPGGAGSLNSRRYTRGTSNATALGARSAAQIYEALQGLRQSADGADWQRQHEPVLLKAMLVHGASWGENYGAMLSALSALGSGMNPREHAARFLGYGSARPTRMLSCIDQRATIIGWGDIADNEVQYHSFPLPNCLNGLPRTHRRLTVTLAWFTPGNAQHRYYRRAKLWFENPDPGNLLHINRKEVTWHPMQRGSVQHDILEGDGSLAYPSDAALEITVKCSAYAGVLEGSVSYALIASLEVAEGIALPIYDEVATRIRLSPPVSIAP